MGITQIKERIRKSFDTEQKVKLYFTLAALCIVLLLLIKPSADTPEPTPAAAPPEPEESYSEALERSLEEIISQIQGVGKVSVMVTVEGTAKKVYAADKSESDSKNDEKTVILGSKEALLESTEYPRVKGVLVVCSGGKSAAVKEKVVDAVSTVLEIPTSKVCVQSKQ